jgi:hypothetical protein
VYQASQGGKTVVPLELKGRLLGSSNTPRLSQIVSWKYGHLSAHLVREDLRLNHNLLISSKLVQSISDHVATIAYETEADWVYALPVLPQVVTHISLGRDGTTTAIRSQGYRETMCGTISLYDGKGVRQHTIYTACAPEHGKSVFNSVLSMEIARIKHAFPHVTYVGIADGAKDNWTYLAPHVQAEILDFYHVTEYLSAASSVLIKGRKAAHKWLEDACHDLKNNPAGAERILNELKTWLKNHPPDREGIVQKTLTYFANNLHRMDYPAYQAAGYPIGSGVTEAACKCVVKQRLSLSGMRWSLRNAEGMLIQRALLATPGRWEQFWAKYMTCT